MTKFEQAFEYLMINEGGYSNDPNDRGGATRYGIIRSEASRWFKRPVSVDEMRKFPIDVAKDIYFSWYWSPLACPLIKGAGMATCMFDIGVVRGIGVPPKYAQRICNTHGHNLVVDGHIGPKTLEAMNSIREDLFIEQFSNMVAAGFRAIVANRPNQVVFLKGWLRRAERLKSLI